MTVQTASSAATPAQLWHMSNGVIVAQALYAAAKLGVADLLNERPTKISDLAARLNANESALLRLMRFLTSHAIFEETTSGVFSNTELSQFLRTGIPNSIRSLLIFRGSEFFFTPFGEILYTIETGLPAREKLYGTNAFEHLKEDPEAARIFDDAMTNASELLGPAIAGAYDFAAWGSLMDVGGGNGLMLAAILQAHPRLNGVLADLPHVLERARERGFLNGALESRCSLQACDFFEAVPPGCRVYFMKSVIHDWDDKRAHRILANCRRAVPDNGALLLAEWALPNGNLPVPGRFMDIAMMVLTGGRERSVEEYRKLLAGAGFRLNNVFPVPGEFQIIEALPV